MTLYIKTGHQALDNMLLQDSLNKCTTNQRLNMVFLDQPRNVLWVATKPRYLDLVSTTKAIRLNRNKRKLKRMQFGKWLRNQIQCISRRQTPCNSNHTCNWICLQKENKQTIIKIMSSTTTEPTPSLRIPKSSRRHLILSWPRSRQREALINKLDLAQNHQGINLKTQ